MSVPHLAALVFFLSGLQAVPTQADSALDAQVRAVAASLRCPVCQGLSIQDSPSELAQEMRNLIRERLLAGESPDQIRAYFVSRYGEWVLLEPEARGFNLAVWTVPLAALLGGIALVIWVVHRWTRRAEEAAVTPLSEDELARVRRELERFEPDRD